MKRSDRRPVHPPLLALLVAWCLLLVPSAAVAQQAGEAPVKEEPPTASEQAPDPSSSRFFDAVTVSATLNPALVKETPGTVSVIDAGTIARRLVENVADLVKFEPGVYIESNLTRIGLNGFNIRGIGGNRVMTQIDGVETSEQFDFGPFNVHQFTLDIDALKSAEISRSAGSSLYGSDALGGVVTFFTKDPADYLAGRRFHIGAKTLYDGRAGDASSNVVLAGSGRRLQGSLLAGIGVGHEVANKGSVTTENATRTAPNLQDRRNAQALGKLVFVANSGNVLRGVFEVADNDIETQAFSSRTPTTLDVDADDVMSRYRVSIDHTLENRGGLNQWRWHLYTQDSDTRQVVDEVVLAGPVTMNRRGTLDFEQTSYGGGLQGRKAIAPGGETVLFTFGVDYQSHVFDMLRDRTDVNAATGAVVPATNLILPSKYFPKSHVREAGSYVQAEVRIGRMTIVPGVRYDRFTLDADENDGVFLATLSPVPSDFSAGAVSGKLGASFAVSGAVTLHAQYAGGFRAPPYSAINSGFTNLLGGYTSVPNPDLEPETSDNVELGVRSVAGPVSVGVTGFWNSYDDFILQAQRGVNPATGLLEFQYQNVAQVSIRGVELQADAQLAASLRLRGSYAIIRGRDVSTPAEAPLDTIAPDQGAVGLQYSAPSNRWGTELTLRAVAAQSQETAGPGLFAPDGFAVVDIFGWFALTDAMAVRAAVLNLTDAKYFEWPNVRGRQAADPVIDRYSSPGVSGMVSLSYGW